MKRFFAAVLTALMLIGALVTTGCGEIEIPTKEYSKAGITLTLPATFVETEHVSYTYTLQSVNVTVTAIKEEFELFNTLWESPADASLHDYAELVITANALPEDTPITESDGLTSFTYENDANGKTYFYYATVFKGSDAFWLVQFACDAQNKEEYEPTLIEYAKTVVVE